MEATRTTVCVGVDLALAQASAFDVLVEELVASLAQSGMGFEAGANGRVTAGEFEVGRVVVWKPGELIRLEWHQANWKAEEVTTVEVRFEPVEGGTRVTMEHRGWGGLISNSTELASWFASS